MTYDSLNTKYYKDLKHFNNDDWDCLSSTIILIFKSKTQGELQPADIEDYAQDILRRLFEQSKKSPPNLEREEAPLMAYVRGCIKHSIADHFRKASKSPEMQIEDENIDFQVFHTPCNNAEWVDEDYNSLSREDRKRLEEDVFGEKSILEIAQGSKKVANKLYKQNFDARRKFRSALLHTAHQFGLHIRGYAPDFQKAA